MNMIKPCALTSINVNYTPDGSYMTYETNGSMVGYDLNLTFQEIEPIYRSDQEQSTIETTWVTNGKTYFRNVPDFNYVKRLEGEKYL